TKRPRLDQDAAPAGQSVVTHNAPNPWKPIAIVLALMLAAVLIYTALVVAGVMELGMSLL
ncbi:MAG: hypothetical protein WBD84_08655, partial [Methyloceanibacter sp.]